MSEDELVASLARIYGAHTAPPHVALGIGDDAAVLAAGPGRVVSSVDAAVEGVHFHLSYAPPPVLGARAFRAAASDLAAMGARPSAALISLALPPDRPELALALSEGVAEAARVLSCPVIGGNLTRASEVSIHTTVLGTLPPDGPLLTRSGARVGDALFVTGTLGAAALGLAAIERGRSEDPRLAPFAQRWRHSRAQVELGQLLLDVASACLDVSDGLARDGARLASASGVTLFIEAEALPLEPGHEGAARVLGLDPLTLAVTGGEDYELLFTAPTDFAAPWAQRIGEVGARSDRDVLLRSGGREVHLARLGHDHFG